MHFLRSSSFCVLLLPTYIFFFLDTLVSNSILTVLLHTVWLIKIYRYIVQTRYTAQPYYIYIYIYIIPDYTLNSVLFADNVKQRTWVKFELICASLHYSDLGLQKQTMERALLDNLSNYTI